MVKQIELDLAWNMSEVCPRPTSGVRFSATQAGLEAFPKMLSTALVVYASAEPSEFEKAEAAATARCIAWLKAGRVLNSTGERGC